MRVMLIMSIFCIFFFAASACPKEKNICRSRVSMGCSHACPVLRGGSIGQQISALWQRRASTAIRDKKTFLVGCLTPVTWAERAPNIGFSSFTNLRNLLELKKWCSLNSPFTPDTAFIKYLFDMAKAGENTGFSLGPDCHNWRLFFILGGQS